MFHTGIGEQTAQKLSSSLDSCETPGYATINEIKSSEVQREKKKSRKAKSIQNALKAVVSRRSSKKPAEDISGPEMGFKPQFRSNPLQQLPIPPTPPPTPATGASSESECHD